MMEEVINKKITAGKKPMGLAATVLYVSSLRSDEKLPQKYIAAAPGVTEVTIRNRFKELKKLLQQVDNPPFISSRSGIQIVYLSNILELMNYL